MPGHAALFLQQTDAHSTTLHRYLRELQSRTMPAAIHIQAHMRGRLLRQRLQRLTCAPPRLSPCLQTGDAKLTAARRARKAGERRGASSAAGAASWGASASSRRWMCGTAASGRYASGYGLQL